jgi:hypothetical protein
MMILTGMLPGCANGSSTATVTTTSASAAQTSTAPTATTVLEARTYQAANFTLTIPKGWESIEIDGGVQLYKRFPSMSGEIFEVSFRGSGQQEDLAKQKVEELVKKHDGTTPESVDLFGLTFWTTSFRLTGVPQKHYYCVKAGVLITILYKGINFESNPVFKEILDSITLS